jgi:3-oxoacyl-[acyl-carrier-protein] synthase II
MGSPDFWASQLGISQVARVEGVEDDPEFPDDRKGALAAAALRDLPPVAGARYGLFLGTGLSSLTPFELEQDLYPSLKAGRFDREVMAKSLSGIELVRRHLPETVTGRIQAKLAQTNPVIEAETSFSACAAAAQAIAVAARAVSSKRVDIAIAGGHDSMLHPVGIMSFVVLGALSPGVARPFDICRDGFLLGEGAALLQLEREEDAQARGAVILGRVLGAGSSVDAWNVTAPHPEGRGAELAMRRALKDAGLQPDDIDYVNAHGTGTPVGDKAEALAIARVLKDVPVSSFKGAIGHTIAAAGAVEAALCLACFQEEVLPMSVGLEELDPECPAHVLIKPVQKKPKAILSNSFGFGGQNCALILGSP